MQLLNKINNTAKNAGHSISKGIKKYIFNNRLIK